MTINSNNRQDTQYDTTSFSINPGDKIVVKAVLNPNPKKADDPDDILFEWCANIS